MNPLRLPGNQLHRFYSGGEAISRFRGAPATDDHAPEDWVGSTATVFGEGETGLSRLPDGRALRDAIAAEPEAFLGTEHAERFGPGPALLVKLLDAGERLPVHCHPDRAFARRLLGSPHGKTEAWVIVEARDGASVRVGFRDEVDEETLAGWVERQEVEPLLASLNELPVAPGDTLFVPAGLPHAIGEGIFLVELQEPTDFSILLEWAGFPIDGAQDGHLGLGFDAALEAVDRSAWGERRLAALLRRDADGAEPRPGVRALLPPEADGFFRAERVRPDPEGSLEPGFSILVVLAGCGRLETERGGALELAAGETLLVPYAAGSGRLTGPLDVLRCLPPDPHARD